MTTAMDNLHNLYENKNNDADVILIVHGMEVKAHKYIISGRSEVLANMLGTPELADSEGRHLINDPKIEIDDFRNFLKFLYFDECEITDQNVATMLHLGNMYFVSALKEKCSEFIKCQCYLDSTNLWYYAEWSLKHEEECSDLLKKCFDVFLELWTGSSMVYHIEEEPGIRQISSELIMKLIKECPRIPGFEEDSVFRKVFEWSRNECTESKTIKAVMQPFMEHFDLEKLTYDSIIKIIRPNELLPSSEYEQFLCDFIEGTPDRMWDTPYTFKFQINHGYRPDIGQMTPQQQQQRMYPQQTPQQQQQQTQQPQTLPGLQRQLQNIPQQQGPFPQMPQPQQQQILPGPQQQQQMQMQHPQQQGQMGPPSFASFTGFQQPGPSHRQQQPPPHFAPYPAQQRRGNPRQKKS